MIKKIGVIGSGYVGLVSATCFAHLGFNVIVVDNDENKIANIKKCELPIYEAGLPEMLREELLQKNISFSTDYSDLKDVEVVILAVGTPMESSGDADLSYLYSAIDSLMSVVQDGAILVLKSTVPIGTANKLKQYLVKQYPSKRYNIVSNPEFLREGNALYDFMNPDRIVVGAEGEEVKAVMHQLYLHFAKSTIPIVFTDNTTAEMIKYAANSYLAMRIAYINEITMLCENSGASIEDVAMGIGCDGRIGHHYLRPGPGFGGSCFPKDTVALNAYARNEKIEVPLLSSIMKSNNRRIDDICFKLKKILGQHECKNIAILGVTFKAATDDMRDSPTIHIINFLIENGFSVKCYDPSGTKQFNRFFNFQLEKELSDVFENADAAVILTEWVEFSLIPQSDFAQYLSKKVLCDLRNITHPLEMKKHLKYYNLGRLC
jgi:UDPglucose 6-dehydrogenase